MPACDSLHRVDDERRKEEEGENCNNSTSTVSPGCNDAALILVRKIGLLEYVLDLFLTIGANPVWRTLSTTMRAFMRVRRFRKKSSRIPRISLAGVGR